MITIEAVDITDEELQKVREAANVNLTLWQYRCELLFSPGNLIAILVIIIVSYYSLIGYFDPAPCCDFDGQDRFSWCLRLGFVGMWVGIVYQTVKSWGTSQRGYQAVMAAVARARATEASGTVWRVHVALDETTFGVMHEHGLYLFSSDPSGGTRLLEILNIAADIREPLTEGEAQPCEWQWRQFPGSEWRSALITSGPIWRIPTYEISRDEPLQRFFHLIEEATPVQEGLGFDLALFADPPAELERRVALLDDAARSGTRARTSTAV